MTQDNGMDRDVACTTLNAMIDEVEMWENRWDLPKAAIYYLRSARINLRSAQKVLENEGGNGS